MVTGLMVLGAGAPFDSPVADAAERGDTDAVRALLEQGADVNAAQPDGMTALHWAAVGDHVEIATMLVYAGATVKTTTRLGGYTPLHLASRNGSTGVAEVLLDAGADPNRFTSTGVTAAHFAADADADGVIRLLAARGADLDAQDTFAQRTPLMFAAVKNATKAVSALVEAGADLSLVTRVTDYEEVDRLNREDQQRRNRIRDAAIEPEEDQQAERRGGPPGAPAQRGAPGAPAEPQAQQGQQGAPGNAAAAGRGQPDPGEPEKPDEKKPAEPEIRALSSTEQIGQQGGFTALHYAARDGNGKAARLLVEAGADVNQLTAGDQSSPLLVAVINGNYDLAKDLLEAGADPNLVSDDGAAPLFATLNIEWSLRTWYPQPAMFRQQNTTYLELMELLLAAGADPNQQTSTHIWYAAYNAGRMGVDFTGATPFWRAAYAADVKAMKLLVANGADPNISTTNLPSRRRFFDPDVPQNPDNDEPEPQDPSGLPPVPIGGPAVHPIHAASGVGFGTSRVAQQHRSVPDGWLPSIRYMIEELGVDPNLRDMDGFAPIHHAAARGDNATILYLVSKGADVTLISRRGQTTADMANSPEQRAQPHPATVALLEKLGSKNNHQCRSCGESR